MRNRIIALVLCAGMLLLGGCASDTGTTDNTSEPTAGSTPSSVETEAPSEESGEPISEPEDPVEAEEPQETSGIIAMVAEITSDYSFTILSIDPDTGEQNTISTIVYPGTSTDSTGECYYFPAITRIYTSSLCEWVSSDLQKVATTKQLGANGEYHAGWFDTSGTFFDVTVAVGMQAESDFDAPTKHRALGFSDGQFVFEDAETGEFYYVPMDNIAPDTVQLGNPIADTLPDTPRDYYFCDWIDDSRYLADYCPSSYDEKTVNVIVDATTNAFTEYVSSDVRFSWNGAVSPDGTEIAFISSPRSGSAAPDLYITSIAGSDPAKVDTVLSFSEAGRPFAPNWTQYPTSGRTCTVLLDWR